MTTLNYWHYIVLFISFIIVLAGIFLATKQEEKESKIWMIISFSVISLIIGGFSFYAVDKLTKFAEIHRLKSKRVLVREQVMYSGVVRNEGKHEIGTVTLEIKLVNRGLESGSMKTGALFEQGSIADFFKTKENKLIRPQQVLEEFVIAKNLKAGESEEFVVYMPYPPNFSGSAEHIKIHSH
ncbi:DUF2393 family protein [Sulfurimonas sp.]|uniref:DUF2393 family protein n=1 Tax=Sulfurimonas sp. TaxID=2022749 RepID=UPI0025CDA0EB|nr:DUF2393 family protein [Sulfurimonas sp.]MDD5157501.1 DUF2393 family protein [Sulfurimonas sp.]